MAAPASLITISKTWKSVKYLIVFQNPHTYAPYVPVYRHSEDSPPGRHREPLPAVPAKESSGDSVEWTEHGPPGF
jgi:hypothetical protein